MLKNLKGWLRAAALCAAFCLLLTGCSIPMQEKRCRWRNCCVRPALRAITAHCRPP